MNKKTKYYAVRQGRKIGIYLSWSECEAQVKGYPNASFKSFATREEAERYVAGDFGGSSPVAVAAEENFGTDIYVDGSYRDGRYSWGYAVYQEGVLVHSDHGLGQDAEAAAIRNVAGELAATVEAVRWAVAEKLERVQIHHDYSGIAAWAEGSWQAKNKFTQAYAQFMQEYRNLVRFVKVAGHTGVEGNELADRLAKAALDKENAQA